VPNAFLHGIDRATPIPQHLHGLSDADITTVTGDDNHLSTPSRNTTIQ